MNKTLTSVAKPTKTFLKYIALDSESSVSSNLLILVTLSTIIATSSPNFSFKVSKLTSLVTITSCNKAAIIVVASTFKSLTISVTYKGCVIKSSPLSLFIPLCNSKA